MTDDQIVAIDLFCGAGGFSEGLHQACDELGGDLRHAAINHWQPAVSTHERNHPDAVQYHSKIEQLHPPDVVDDLVDEDVTDVHTDDSVSIDLLTAGPECTHFSGARGGKPVSEQKRVGAWQVLRWLEQLDVQAFVLENVPEIQSWGRVEDGEPTRSGEIFDAWIQAMNALGYAVVWDTLNAKHFGDPTDRDRFFLIGHQTAQPTFPSRTHSDGDDDLPDCRTAAEIIDWSDTGESIWTRDLTNNRIHSPPKDTTMARIAEGVRRHCSDVLAPFADVLEDFGREEIRMLRRNRVVNERNAATAARLTDVPFLVRKAGSQEQQLDSVILKQQDGGKPNSVGEPLPTVAKRGGHQLVAPSICRWSHSGATLDVDDPMPTIATERGGVFSLSAPYLTPLYNSRSEQAPRTRDTERPLMTIPASKSPAGVAEPVLRPFIDDYQSNPQQVTEPLRTVPASDRYALCVPELWPWGLDINYRMLQPAELKQAQGFPADYKITGTKSDRTEQIGNAVPVNLARSLITHVLSIENPSLASFGGGIQTDPDTDIPAYSEVAAIDD